MLKLRVIAIVSLLIVAVAVNCSSSDQVAIDEAVSPTLTTAQLATAAPTTTSTLKPVPTDTPAQNPVSDRQASHSCHALFPDREIVKAKDYIIDLERAAQEVHHDPKYWYISPTGGETRNGPKAYWHWEVISEDVSTRLPETFDTVRVGDHEMTWDDYVGYSQAVCDAIIGTGTKRQALILRDKFVHFLTDWPAHASHWEPFPYFETGPVVYQAPSPPRLEHYTKYITGAGVIIVGGDLIPNEAFLAARESVIYMTSARPEFRDILKANEVRISLFHKDRTELPEYDEPEPGGTAMTHTEATMTANANWMCYPGNWDMGGNTVIHEMVHTINHVVFEEINETYFYERIFKIGLNSIEAGLFDTTWASHRPDSQKYDAARFLGEFWAITSEGYIMDSPGFKESHDTRQWIAENDPDVYELHTQYWPTEPWEYCKGVEQFIRKTPNQLIEFITRHR